jgi:lysophospholipase L1-like esterase
MTRRAGLSGRAIGALLVPVLLATAGCTSEHQTAAVAPFGTDNVVSVPGTVAPAAPSAEGRIKVERLAMVGDSITEGSKDELEKAFAGIGLDNVEINAEGGRRMVTSSSISSGVEGIEQVLEDGATPDLWVIALGTNDVANLEPLQYADAIDEVLAALPPDAPVVWVDCYLSKFKSRSEEFDAVLREVLVARGNAKVVDWASIAGEDGVLVDGVHPSGFGRDELSRRVAETVSDWMA